MPEPGIPSHEVKRNAPILELQVAPGAKVSFIPLSDFRSPGFRTNHIDSLPPIIAEQVKRAEEQRLAQETNTYNNTTKYDQNWHTDVYRLVHEYVQGDGNHILKKMGKDTIYNLTPKEAIELTVGVLTDLTKYTSSDVYAKREDATLPTKADKSTVIDLLQDGIANKDTPSWEGNGVCRNFAWMGKAIFESLRDSTPGGSLSTAYCFYDGGSAHAPKIFQGDSSLHAWNTFLVVDADGSTQVTVADFTWTKRYKETGDLVSLDHTKTRVEPMIYDFVGKIEGSDGQKKKEMRKVCNYYADMILTKDETGDDASEKARRGYFMTRVLELIETQHLTKDDVTPELKLAFAKHYEDLVSHTDIKQVAIFNKVLPGSAFTNDFVRKYVARLDLKPTYTYASIITPDDQLQRIIFDTLKGREDFEGLVRKSPQVELRYNEIYKI